LSQGTYTEPHGNQFSNIGSSVVEPVVAELVEASKPPLAKILISLCPLAENPPEHCCSMYK